MTVSTSYILVVSLSPNSTQDYELTAVVAGTTGLPKGVLREAAGHAVGLNLSIKYLFGIRGPGDVMFCASDIGWVVGHSYILYAPLLAGATTVLFEGKPVGTPNAGTFWRVVEEHKVNILSTAPTALRAIRRDDPENKFFEAAGERGGLKQLRALFLAGERSEPSIVQMYQELLKKYCAPGALVIDNWWSSESGSPISGIAMIAAAGKQHSSTEQHTPLPIKPGSAGKAMPGFDVRIVDDEGTEVGKGRMGNIVLGIPLAPTGLTTLFNDEERFYKGYLKRFDGKWIDTGDAGMIDEDGYVHVMSRSDDIINVAAHRFSTGIYTHLILVETLLIKHYRFHRASDLVVRQHRRMLRSRHTRRLEGTASLRVRHPLHRRPSHVCRSVRRTVPRHPEVGAGADRCDRSAGRHGPGQRDDPQDAVGQDVAAGASRAGRERGLRRFRQGSAGSRDGRGCERG
jgi:hypothetical protein